MRAIKNTFRTARFRLEKALRVPVQGASKLGGRIRDGAGSAVSKARSGVAKLAEKAKGVTEGPRARVNSAVETAQARPRIAIAIAAAVLIGFAWIAWAIYVTSDNGPTAGLGVVVTWPVLLGAIVLVAAPFVGIYFLVQRFRPAGEAGADSAAPVIEEEAESEDAVAEEDDPEDDSSDDDSGDEDSSEDDSAADNSDDEESGDSTEEREAPAKAGGA